MTFKWDWEKQQLTEGEAPEVEKEWYDLFFVGALVYWGYWFVEHAMPWIGKFFFGSWL